jgi:ABC-type lipoprotein release transport system permease subunit
MRTIRAVDRVIMQSVIIEGLVIVLLIFASIMPARKAARLTINEVLAYE